MLEKIYVSKIGDDGNIGNKSNPVATLEKAKVLARENHSLEVIVGQGVYFLDKPLVLNEQDSGRNWFADDDVIFTGSKILGEIEWKEFKDGILQANIDKGLKIDQVYVDKKPQIMSRFPKFDNSQVLQGSTSLDEINERSKAWSKPETGFLRALHGNKWGGNSFHITGKNDDGLELEWVGDNNRGSKIHKDYVMVENIFEELSDECEWFYDDENGIIYIKPETGISLEDALIEVSVSSEIVKFAGAKNITFSGFEIENTKRTLFTGKYIPLLRGDWCVVRDGAVFMENCENIFFANNKMNNIGGNAIFVSGDNKNVVIDNNDICNVGSSAVIFAGYPDACREPSFWSETPKPEVDVFHVHKTTIEDDEVGPLNSNYPRECVVSNNHIKNIGIYEKQSSHVAISVAHKISVLKNTLNVGPRAAVNVNDGTFGGHIIANNDIFDVQKETDDHGMFNSWGRDRFWSMLKHDTLGVDGKIKEPYSLIDAMTPVQIHDNRIHFGGRMDGGSTFGIDLDDGSTNYEIYNNLCLNMGIKLREGFHRKVYNNICINGRINLHCTYENSFDNLQNNIVITNNPYALAATNYERFLVSKDNIDKNWFYNFGGKIFLPEFWTDMNFDANSYVENIDPLFKNPQENDYTVTNQKMAEEIGFINFPMDNFGKDNCVDKAPIFYKTEAINSTIDLEREFWLDAVVTKVDDAIMSSAGSGTLNGAHFQKVAENSVAEKYGFKVSDIVHKLNGEDIIKKSEFFKAYNRINCGEKIKVELVRLQEIICIEFIKE